METSILLAQVIGPIYLVIGIAVLLNGADMKKVVDDFKKSPALIYTAALMGLGVGLLMIATHNVWSADWIGLITLFGWIVTIKGVSLLLFPEKLMKMGDSIRSPQ